MAKARAGVAFGGYSGAIGNVVVAQTQDGLVVRERGFYRGRRSDRQVEHGLRLAVVNRVWDAMSFEEASVWRAYAFGLATRNPQTGGLRVPQAYGLFCGLGTKFLQVHGGQTVPTAPPEGRFLGDVISVTVGPLALPPLQDEPSEEWVLSFVADGANRAGVLTELLGQRLSGPNNLPKARSYVSLGFVAFEAGVPVLLPVGLPGTWAGAARFVEASSGRMTEWVEIGRATVGGA